MTRTETLIAQLRTTHPSTALMMRDVEETPWGFYFKWDGLVGCAVLFAPGPEEGYYVAWGEDRELDANLTLQMLRFDDPLSREEAIEEISEGG